jgi:hypothetical protein
MRSIAQRERREVNTSHGGAPGALVQGPAPAVPPATCANTCTASGEFLEPRGEAGRYRRWRPAVTYRIRRTAVTSLVTRQVTAWDDEQDPGLRASRRLHSHNSGTPSEPIAEAPEASPTA